MRRLLKFLFGIFMVILGAVGVYLYKKGVDLHWYDHLFAILDVYLVYYGLNRMHQAGELEG